MNRLEGVDDGEDHQTPENDGGEEGSVREEDAFGAFPLVLFVD